MADANPTCEDKDSLKSTKDVVATNTALLKDLKTETEKYQEKLDTYRLEQATKEAETSMDEAKAALSKAQKAADTQLKKVKDTPSLQGEATIKKLYETLTKVSNEANKISTTITTSTYEEAVESIAKAKEAATKAGELNKAATGIDLDGNGGFGVYPYNIHEQQEGRRRTRKRRMGEYLRRCRHLDRHRDRRLPAS